MVIGDKGSAVSYSNDWSVDMIPVVPFCPTLTSISPYDGKKTDIIVHYYE